MNFTNNSHAITVCCCCRLPLPISSMFAAVSAHIHCVWLVAREACVLYSWNSYCHQIKLYAINKRRKQNQAKGNIAHRAYVNLTATGAVWQSLSV